MRHPRVEPRSLRVVLLKLRVCQSVRGLHKTVSSVSFDSDLVQPLTGVENSAASVFPSFPVPSLVSAAAPTGTSALDGPTDIGLSGKKLGSELATLPIVDQIATREPTTDTLFGDHPSYAAAAAAADIRAEVEVDACEQCVRNSRPFSQCVRVKYQGRHVYNGSCTNCHWGGQGIDCSLCEYPVPYWYE